MFIPLGDDVESDRLPIFGFFLVGVCAVVWLKSFLVDFGDPYHLELIEFFKNWGLIPADMKAGNYRGIITHMFVHGGVVHLLGNMMALYAFMWTLEGTLGSFKFIVLYILSGLAAGIGFALLRIDSTIPMVGASGAIAGVMGAYAYKFGPTTNIKCLFFLGPRAFVFNVQASVFMGVWVVTQFHGAMTSGPDGGGIAWMAHGFGFAMGGLLMPLLGDDTRKVVRDYHGQLVLVGEGDESRWTNPHTAFELDAAAEVSECPHCGSELNDECLITPGMWKCANPSCVRLVYTEAVERPPQPSPTEDEGDLEPEPAGA